MFRLSRLNWDWRQWWETRHCPHPPECQGSIIVDSGRRKMFWCTRCERSWF